MSTVNPSSTVQADSVTGLPTEQKSINGAACVTDRGFTPSSYSGKITTDGVGVTVALATGARKLLIQSLDLTAAEWAMCAFGISAADSITNLTVAGAIGTTGFAVGSNTNTAGTPMIVGIPALATHISFVTGVNAATQVLLVTQGV